MLLEQGDRTGAEQALARAVRREDRGALLWALQWHREERKIVARLKRRLRKVERRQKKADQRADAHGDADAAYRNGMRLIGQWEAFDQKRYLIEWSMSADAVSLTDMNLELQRVDNLLKDGVAALQRAA